MAADDEKVKALLREIDELQKALNEVPLAHGRTILRLRNKLLHLQLRLHAITHGMGDPDEPNQ